VDEAQARHRAIRGAQQAERFSGFDSRTADQLGGEKMTIEQRLLQIVRDLNEDRSIGMVHEPIADQWIIWSEARNCEVSSSQNSLLDALVAAIEGAP
jgi:hypothetical protein